MPVSVTERAILSFLSRCLTLLLGKVTVEPLGTDTSLLRAVSNVPTKFSYIFFKKKPSIIRTLSNTDNGH